LRAPDMIKELCLFHPDRE